MTEVLPTVVGRWSTERAQSWGRNRAWMLGCNFIPSSASNQLEMWQEETFDRTTIDRELGWAAALGFNAVRVFLHDLLWNDRTGFLNRVEQFLEVAAGHRLDVMFVFFDDCWNPESAVGRQLEPAEGQHNSRWVQSPGERAVRAGSNWDRLEDYVTGVIGAYREDSRILAWDVYNEPGNFGLGAASVPLLSAVFAWARSVRPLQPLTSAPRTPVEPEGGATWAGPAEVTDLQLAASDVISFHSYDGGQVLRQLLPSLIKEARPVLCTEYLGRSRGSTFAAVLPILHEHGIGAFNWGLVSGRTQTHIAWQEGGTTVSPVWFSDILRSDGSAYDAAELNLIRQLAGWTSA